MATSVSELHKAYKKRGGTKSFVEYRKERLAKAKNSSSEKTATARAQKAKKLVSGNLEKNMRKPVKRKYST